MIDKDQARLIQQQWNNSNGFSHPPARRLEFKMGAFVPMMRIIMDGSDSVQNLWDSTGLEDIYGAVTDAEAPEGGTYAKSYASLLQLLHLAFREWAATNVKATVDGTPVTVPLSPKQILNMLPVMGQAPAPEEPE